MQNMLGNFKESEVINVADGKKKVDIEQDETTRAIIERLMEFKVGDYTHIYGTQVVIYGYEERIMPVPKGFELRIRYISHGKFGVFYPKGYLVWIELYNILGVRSKYKGYAKEDSDGIPFVRIWRSE